MHIILIFALLGLVAALIFQKKKSGAVQNNAAEKIKTGSTQKTNKPTTKKSEKLKSSNNEATVSTDINSKNNSLEADNVEKQLEDSASKQPVKVSVEEVDPLTEYKVYTEFGYFDKAAEALSGYIKIHKIQAPEVLLELAALYLSLCNHEALVEFILDHRENLTIEQVEEIVKAGLEEDPNSLELRVLADELLNWDVDTVNNKVSHSEANVTESKVLGSEKNIEYLRAPLVESEEQLSVSISRSVATDSIHKLVVGQGPVTQVTHEELQVISAMLPNDHAVKLMRTFADYTTFTHKFDRSLAKLKNPAAALVDALGLDYQNKNIDAFAHHLWELYNILGKNGQNIKDKMLGWGYSLGNHEVLNRLAMVTNEQEVRDIGREFGYRIQTSKNSGIHLSLVSDDVGGGLAKSLGRDVNSILQEADAYLMYGQLDEAMQTLEQGIKLHKQEPQLYVNLFELYERAESWERLEEFSKRLRTETQDLPEEVILVMAKLTQKFKNNNIGMVA